MVGFQPHRHPSDRTMRRKAVSILKNSNVSIVKTIGAALAAITVAIISSRLAGYINSLLLVGIASVSTAVASEVYRMILSATSRKVVTTARKTVQAINTSQDLADTQEIPVVEDEEPKEEKGTQSNQSALLADTPPNDRLTEEPSRLLSWITGLNPRTVKRHFRWALLFLSMVLLSVGISYLLTGGEKEHIVYRNTIVKETSPATNSATSPQEVTTTHSEEKTEVPASTKSAGSQGAPQGETPSEEKQNAQENPPANTSEQSNTDNKTTEQENPRQTQKQDTTNQNQPKDTKQDNSQGTQQAEEPEKPADSQPDNKQQEQEPQDSEPVTKPSEN